MNIFMTFCIRTDSFIVWAVNPRNSSDNPTVRVNPFIFSGVLQSDFGLATSVAIHQYAYCLAPHISKITLPNFTRFSVHVTCSRGSIPSDCNAHPVLWIASSCLHIMGPLGQNKKRRCLVEYARWLHWRRSLPSPTPSCSDWMLLIILLT